MAEPIKKIFREILNIPTKPVLGEDIILTEDILYAFDDALNDIYAFDDALNDLRKVEG